MLTSLIARIMPADSALTTILGNIQMEYDPRSVNCDDYNWFVRAFKSPNVKLRMTRSHGAKSQRW